MGLALVTGGSRGIGKAIAIKLAEAGNDIAICFSGNEAAANETVNELLKIGVKAMAFRANVSDADEVANLISQIKESLGNISILVNNAGITKDGLMLKMSESDFDDVINVNLKGTFLCSKAVLKDMMKARDGRIVNVSSIVGLTGNAGQVNYSASKAGLIGLTKSMAKEYGAKGIIVNAIAPGFIETEMTDKLPEEVKQNYLAQIPVRAFGSIEDVANLVDFLTSDKAKYITGQVISIDGGMN